MESKIVIGAVTHAGYGGSITADRNIEQGLKTILLVDDEPVVLDVGSEMLSAMGYEVLTASNGAEAVEIFRCRAKDVALVILDLIMPLVDGYNAFKALRKIDPTVRVLLTSGYSEDGDAARMLEMGCRGFLQKPFSMRNLKDAMSQILSGGTFSDTKKF